MLTANVDVSGGLVTGARSEVFHVVTNTEHSVLVKFDNPQVGCKAIQTSPYRNTYPYAVPLSKYEVIFAREK